MAQKRSENTYQKINTIFKRDIDNIIMPYDYVLPEYKWLENCKFIATEKIDGTCIRLEVFPFAIENPENDNIRGEFKLSYRGKTDNANIPIFLLDHLKNTYPEEKVLSALSLPKYITAEFLSDNGYIDINNVPKYTIYGEGHGNKIQKCGSDYIKDGNGFIVFDVKVNDLYLLRNSAEDIANKLNAPIVPIIGEFTVKEAIKYVKKGFTSLIAENKEMIAEGLVLTTPYGLHFRNNQRIIFKIKHRDFVQYYNRYGTYNKVKQIPNKFY